MKSFLVHKLTCPRCSSSCIGETCSHLKTRIEAYIKKGNKSHIFKHLHFTATCFDSYSPLCFKIIDKANSEFDLKIGENLNAQQNNFTLTLSLQILLPLLFSVFVWFFYIFCVFLSSIVFIISDTDYRHLLLS